MLSKSSSQVTSLMKSKFEFEITNNCHGSRTHVTDLVKAFMTIQGCRSDVIKWVVIVSALGFHLLAVNKIPHELQLFLVTRYSTLVAHFRTKNTFLNLSIKRAQSCRRQWHHLFCHSFNHATKSSQPFSNHANRVLSQPFIQSWMANCKPLAACRAHKFSSSIPSTSFASKPPCRPTLRPPLATTKPPCRMKNTHFYRL